MKALAHSSNGAVWPADPHGTRPGFDDLASYDTCTADCANTWQIARHYNPLVPVQARHFKLFAQRGFELKEVEQVRVELVHKGLVVCEVVIDEPCTLHDIRAMAMEQAEALEAEACTEACGLIMISHPRFSID